MELRKLTREEYESLVKYDYELQAARSQYLRPVGKEGTIVFHELYKDITGEEFERTDLCGSCELRLQMIIAAWYFEAESLYKGKKAAEEKAPAAPKAAPKKKECSTI